MAYLRVSCAGKWGYVPSHPRMFSESGPIEGRMGESTPDATRCLASLKDEVLGLDGGGGLAFGRPGGERNEFLDLSVVEYEGGAIVLSENDVGNGDIVIAMWPEGTLLPGRIRLAGRRVAVDFPVNAPSGRFFVLDEDGRMIISIGNSDGSDVGRMSPRQALVSWLLFTRTPAAARLAERFAVVPLPGFALVTDSQTGRSYRVGACGDQEVQDIRWSLAVAGIKGIAGRYEMEKM